MSIYSLLKKWNIIIEAIIEFIKNNFENVLRLKKYNIVAIIKFKISTNGTNNNIPIERLGSGSIW